MADKSQKMLARTPRGFADRTPDDIRAVEKMMATIRGVYELYGFEPADQPLIEYTDALGKFLPDQDRPNEGVFSFQDDDEQWLSLRYDLTAPMARYVAENYEKLPKPFRSYRSGWVFRNEKPGPGRFRQFMQFDADTVGTPGVAADAEMAMMMADVMEALGIKRGDYVIRVNNRKVLDGVLEAIGLGGDENAGRRLGVLRSLDKFDRLGLAEVSRILGKGRKDESGDFIEGMYLTDDQVAVLNLLFSTKYLLPDGTVLPEMESVRKFVEDNGKTIGISYETSMFSREKLLQAAGVTSHNFTGIKFNRFIVFTIMKMFGADPINKIGYPEWVPDTIKDGVRDLIDIQNLLEAAGYGADRVIFDMSVVRGLEYYTGPVFEAELLAEIPNEDGQIVRFGSVGGGGRYDGLVSRFRGEPVPATGFSIGVSRLMSALKALGKLDTSDIVGPVVVLVMDRDTDSLGRYQKMVSDLRAAGIRAEMYLGGSGMKPQMKYADRRGAPCVIIQGGDERARGVVQIKDLVVGARLAAGIEDHDQYKEARPGQVEVAEAEIVETVRGILAAQKADRG